MRTDYVIENLRAIGELFGRTEKQISDDIKEHQFFTPKVIAVVRGELEYGKRTGWKVRKVTP